MVRGRIPAAVVRVSEAPEQKPQSAERLCLIREVGSPRDTMAHQTSTGPRCPAIQAAPFSCNPHLRLPNNTQTWLASSPRPTIRDNPERSPGKRPPGRGGSGRGKE